MTLSRIRINPWQWSVAMGFNQAELVEGATRVLVCSGQTAMSAEGTPQHPGDMAAQVAMSLDNVEAVLAGAGMTLSNVVQMNIYTTDVDGFFAASGSMVERFDRAGVMPASTLLGISRLAFPELMVELEATAVA
ncbi:RidA family protein [Blastococcus deserti]|uniref:RidA family protein n=1 Tax=Blastococcus deserti TaxID=2259033 RepID=A0ABW4XBA7_9ACTN